jgi:phosphate starvation-inducible PhoH-like protein
MQHSRVARHQYPVKRVKTNKNKNQIDFLKKSLDNNATAFSDGPKTKKWTHHDLRSIKPLTANQAILFDSFYDDKNIVAYGSAGTGKSYITLWLALQEIFEEKPGRNRIIIVRSCVASREMGHLPGTEEEKMEVYEKPYSDIIGDIIGKSNAYTDMKKAGFVEFTSTSHIRGISWNDAIVVIDEIQNMNFGEINTIMGRIGKNTKICILGDFLQNDLTKKKNDESGFPMFLQISKNMDFAKIHFTRDDIVRSNFCKSWIIAYERYLESF